MPKETLLQITEAASSLREPPLQKVVVKRWLPSFVALGIKVFLLPFILLDQLAKKVATMIIKPPFKKVGACKKRGNCCYYITMRKRKGLFNKLQLFWMTQVHRFFLRDIETYEANGHEYYLLGCDALKKDGSCGQYRLRPGICRQWPIIEIFGYPKLLKGCGFFMEARSRKFQSIVDEYRKDFSEK